MQSDLNQSTTWLSSTLNQFHAHAKKERKVKKAKRKENDEIPASMMSKIDELVRQRVDAEMSRTGADRFSDSTIVVDSQKRSVDVQAMDEKAY